MNEEYKIKKKKNADYLDEEETYDYMNKKNRSKREKLNVFFFFFACCRIETSCDWDSTISRLNVSRAFVLIRSNESLFKKNIKC